MEYIWKETQTEFRLLTQERLSTDGSSCKAPYKWETVGPAHSEEVISWIKALPEDERQDFFRMFFKAFSKFEPLVKEQAEPILPSNSSIDEAIDYLKAIGLFVKKAGPEYGDVIIFGGTNIVYHGKANFFERSFSIRCVTDKRNGYWSDYWAIIDNEPEWGPTTLKNILRRIKEQCK